MEFEPVDARPIIDELCSRVPPLAHEMLAENPKEPTTCCTKALKSVLDALGTQYGYGSLYTKRSAGMREFLLDFVWWDDKAGCGALGCESEFGNRWYPQGNALLIGEDFDKLLSFKAPTKLIVFNSYTGMGTESILRQEILAELDRYLGDYSYHLKGETYIAIDMSEVPKVWICKLASEGKNSGLKFQNFPLN